MKKVLAFLLTFALLLVPFSTLSFAASTYTDVTLTGTDGGNTSFNGDINCWVLYLTTSGYESADWSYKYQGFTYEYNGVTGTTNQVSSADGSRLYCTIPASAVPATDGAVFTIKAGRYEPDDAGTTVGLNILNDLTIVSVDGRLVVTQIINPTNVDTFAHSASSFHFTVYDGVNKIQTGVESWVRFLSPSNCDGTRIDTPGWTSTYSGVFIDGTPMDYWGAHFKNTGEGEFYIDGLNAVAGTKVTVKGHFVSSEQDGWTRVGNFFLKELYFTYDGEKWNFSKPTEYTNVTLNGTVEESSKFNAEKDAWELYLTNTGITDGTWTYKYKGFTYEVGGASYTTSQVSTSDPGFSYSLYCTIPSSVLPADAPDGTQIVIKAGNYDWDDSHSYQGISIQNDLSLIVDDGMIVISPTYYNDIEITAANGDSDKGFYFIANDSYANISWDNNIKAKLGDTNGVFKNGVKTSASIKKVSADTWYVALSDVSANAVDGDKITLKGSFRIAGAQFTFNEKTFEFKNGAWTLVSEVNYTEYEGSPVFNATNIVEGVLKGFYFTAGESEFPYAEDWSLKATAADEEESGVFLNGEKTSVFLKKVDSDLWYVCLSDAEIVPEYGDEITVVGSFIYDTHRITFDNELLYEYEDPSVEEPEPAVYTGTPVLSETEKYGSSAGFYFTSEDGAPYAEDWSLGYNPADGEADGVFVNGTKTEITLKKVNTNLWYVCVSDAQITLNYGDVVTIKGNFVKDNNTVTFNEASFEYNGKRFGEGEFTATDFTITGLAYSDIIYDTANSRWNMYFTLSTNLPGDVDSTYYPYMTYDINGTEYTEHWFKSSSAHTVNGETIYNLYIPMTQLPSPLDKEYVITLKAGASQGRQAGTNTAHADGIRLTEDYQFVIGNSYSASAPAVDYLMQSGGNENGIYLASSDNFPKIGWDYSLTKVGENDGVFVNGEITDVYLKKYGDGEYYVCLSDKSITAQEGTIVMLKGTFTTANLNFVNFQTAKYIYTDGQWKVYSAYVDVDSTGVSGDANGNSAFDIVDLVRMKKYVAGITDEINLVDADLNGNGKIESNDIVIARKMLLDSIRYETGANLTGVPTYSDDREMRLSAYVSPTTQEGFDDYKAAGFTTLISENRAVYGTEGFAEYMNLAAEKGLDVLVQSGNLQNMLTGAAEYNPAWLQLMCDELSQYSSFRGLFMGDEPRIEHLSSYTTVTNALKLINPKMDLFTSCLQTYTNEEYLWADNSLSLAEKYSKYANAYGNLFGEFTYDFYPFKHSYKSILGYKYDEKDYMRSDWFQNLTLVASNAKGAYDTGITVQSYAEANNAKDHLRTVTEADVSFQVYSALAYGMKSINYFTYGEHWDESVGTTSCMVYKGEKTAVYDAVKNVNNEIKAFDHVLLDFNWQGTVGIPHDNTNGIMNYVDAYTSKRISDAAATNDAIIGCLKDSKGYDGFMLVNATDPSANITETISVTFNNADRAKVYINGVESVVELNNGVYEAALNPGQGIFVIPYNA